LLLALPPPKKTYPGEFIDHAMICLATLTHNNLFANIFIRDSLVVSVLD